MMDVKIMKTTVRIEFTLDSDLNDYTRKQAVEILKEITLAIENGQNTSIDIFKNYSKCKGKFSIWNWDKTLVGW